MASKNIVADLNKGEKLDGDNYDIWHRKIQYLLDEQEVLETLTQSLDPPPEDGTGAQHRRDQEAYKEWVKKDRCARFVMLSSMHNDLISAFEDYRTAREMWDALKAKFGSTSATRLRALTLKFDSYKMRSNTPMKQHLRQMSTMIRELKAAGNNLSDEQQVQAGIRSLPDSWEHMRVNMTHNENIKTFDDLARHLELEAERLEAAKANSSSYMVHSGSRKPSGSKRKNQNNGKRDGDESAPKKANSAKRKRGKRGGKKGAANKACFNCGKDGHFARDCAEPKKVLPNSNSPFVYVTSHVMVAHPSHDWIVDSGATEHVVRDRVGYVEYRRIPVGSKVLYMGNGEAVQVLGVGTYKLSLRGGRDLLIHDVLFAPDVRRNLLSVPALLRLGFRLVFENNNVSIFNGTMFYGSGFISDGLFVLDICYSSNNNSISFLTTADNSTIWHARLGHIGQDRMNRLAREGLLGQLAKVSLPSCEHCLVGKSTRKPFGKATRASFPLQLVHSDICGPLSVRARHGANYFITFIDDYTRYGYVYLISHKSEALDCFKRFMSMVENQKGSTIKALRTDRGREYLSELFKQLCDEKGIQRQLTIPYTPQQNGVAERRNRTLLDMVRSMMAQANLPISFWGDAILAAAYILNRVPSKSVSSTPYELWTGRKPDLGHLRPWGSAGYVHTSSHSFGKLGPRAHKCIFIRYSEESKGYVMLGVDTLIFTLLRNPVTRIRKPATPRN